MLYGTDRSETIDGSPIADIIRGFAGSDTIFGLGGDDYLIGGADADTLDGGAGQDTAEYSDSWESVVVSLASGQGFLGTAQGDRLFNIENLRGSRYDDLLTGNALNNRLEGEQGEDLLDGGDGDDTLFGGTHDDTLKGGGGADTLYGGFGNDILSGGRGRDLLIGDQDADTFKFSTVAECGLTRVTADRILDFSTTQGDKIDLAEIDANTMAAGNQSFMFIGNNEDFYADADPRGQIRFISEGFVGGGYLEGDVNSDRVADFFIWVNASALHADGFAL